MKQALDPSDILTLNNILHDFKRCASEIDYELQKFCTANNRSAATRARRGLREIEKITKKLKSTILYVKKKSVPGKSYSKPENIDNPILKKMRLKDLVGTK